MTYKIFRGTLRESPFAKIQFWYKNIELSRWRQLRLRFHLLKVTLTHHICSSQLLCDLLKGIISLKLSVQKRKNEFRHIFFNANLSLLHSSVFPDSQLRNVHQDKMHYLPSSRSTYLHTPRSQCAKITKKCLIIPSETK